MAQRYKDPLAKTLLYSRQVSCTLNIVLIFLVADCKYNWHQYKTGCVRLFTNHKNVNQARERCKGFQTAGCVKCELVEILSRDDNDRIDALASEQGLYSRSRMKREGCFRDILEIQLCVNETIAHFTVVCLVTWCWTGIEAGGDLVLIQTPTLFKRRSCCSYAN